MRLASLTVLLFAFWLLLSGHYKPWLVILGFLCSLGIAVFASRFRMADEEGHPVHLSLSAITYWPWLVVEIFKAAIDVAKIIVDPKLPISPVMVRIKAGQKSAEGIATYANSITLTPGTISTYVSTDDREILVHALTEEGAEALEEGTMDRRVTAFEGRG